MADRFRYRSLAGDVYDAEVLTADIKGERVPVAIAVPGCTDPVEVRVRLVETDTGERGVCFKTEEKYGSQEV